MESRFGQAIIARNRFFDDSGWRARFARLWPSTTLLRTSIRSPQRSGISSWAANQSDGLAIPRLRGARCFNRSGSGGLQPSFHREFDRGRSEGCRAPRRQPHFPEADWYRLPIEAETGAGNSSFQGTMSEDSCHSDTLCTTTGLEAYLR